MTLITNNDLFQIWLQAQMTNDENNVEVHIMNHIKDKLCIQSVEKDHFINLQKKIKTFCIHLKQKWIKSGRNLKGFSNKYKEWLDLKFDLNNNSEVSKHGGRPIKCFNECSDRTKRRKVNIINTYLGWFN